MKSAYAICVLFLSTSAFGQVFENRHGATEFDAGFGMYSMNITFGNQFRYYSAIDPSIWITGGNHDLEYVMYCVEALVPLSQDSDVKLLVGANVPDQRDYATGYNANIYSTAGRLSIWSTSTVYGGGAYVGLSIDKYFTLTKSLSFGLFGKAAISYFSFEQQINIYESLAPSGGGSLTTKYQQSIMNTTGVGGKFDAGVAFSLYGIRLKPSFSGIVTGDRGNGLVAALGINCCVGFAF